MSGYPAHVRKYTPSSQSSSAIPKIHMAGAKSALVVVVVLLLVVCRDSSAQGCTPAPPNTLMNSTGMLQPGSNVPVVRTYGPGSLFRGSVGGYVVQPWVVFSESQVRDHGLWCQVRKAATDGVSNNNVGEWYYPTTNGLLALNNVVNDSTPYQELKCDNQVGLVVDGDIMDNQGIVRCTTTITGLSPVDIYLAVYKDNVFQQLRSCKLCSLS